MIFSGFDFYESGKHKKVIDMEVHKKDSLQKTLLFCMMKVLSV